MTPAIHPVGQPAAQPQPGGAATDAGVGDAVLPVATRIALWLGGALAVLAVSVPAVAYSAELNRDGELYPATAGKGTASS